MHCFFEGRVDRRCVYSMAAWLYAAFMQRLLTAFLGICGTGSFGWTILRITMFFRLLHKDMKTSLLKEEAFYMRIEDLTLTLRHVNVNPSLREINVCAVCAFTGAFGPLQSELNNIATFSNQQ